MTPETIPERYDLIEATVRMPRGEKRVRCLVTEVQRYRVGGLDFLTVHGRYWTAAGRWSVATRVLLEPWVKLEELAP